MTKAPTTRETADHAELAGVIKYLRREAASNKAKRSGQAHGAHFVTRARKLTQSADAIETLLSEIEALRGQYELDGFTLQASVDQATQAERQRDELRKALEPFAREAESWPELSDTDTLAMSAPDGTASAYDITMGEVRRASALIENQGADHD